MKNRYLDLRRPNLHKNIVLRSNVILYAPPHNERGFQEIKPQFHREALRRALETILSLLAFIPENSRPSSSATAVQALPDDGRL